MAPGPVYNWAGFYIGGGFNDLNFSNANTATGAPTGSNSVNVGGVAGGGQIGYNYIFAPNFLAGFEADISGANINGSVISTDGSTQHNFNTDLFGTVRGRLGLTYNNWLFYGTGGSWGN
jgi:outer membrane immunogenic protein